MRLICIEGLDGVGKESVSKLLEKKLQEKNYKVSRISFPRYDDEFGKTIKYLLSERSPCDPSEMDEELISPLYTLDRIDFFKKHKEVFDLDYLILDRGYYSNFIYQASKSWNKYTKFYIGNYIIDWVLRNGIYEFCGTGLINCERVWTIVLSLSEDDRREQIKNRKLLDNIEKNYQYVDNCNRFLNSMLSMPISDIEQWLRRYCEHRDIFNCLRYNFSQVEENVLRYYFTNVRKINVVHTDDPYMIETVNNQTVDSIIHILSEDEGERI